MLLLFLKCGLYVKVDWTSHGVRTGLSPRGLAWPPIPEATGSCEPVTWQPAGVL